MLNAANCLNYFFDPPFSGLIFLPFHLSLDVSLGGMSHYVSGVALLPKLGMIFTLYERPVLQYAALNMELASMSGNILAP